MAEPLSPQSTLSGIQGSVHKEARRRSVDEGRDENTAAGTEEVDDGSATTSPRSTLNNMQTSISATVRRRSIDEGEGQEAEDSPPRTGDNSSAEVFAQSRDRAGTVEGGGPEALEAPVEDPFGAFASTPSDAPLTAIHTVEAGRGPVAEAAEEEARAEELRAAKDELDEGGAEEAPAEEAPAEENPAPIIGRERGSSKQLPPSAEIDAASPQDWQRAGRPKVRSVESSLHLPWPPA